MLSGHAIDIQKMPILGKKSSFPIKLILILKGIVTSKIVAFGAHTLKSRCTQNEPMFGADFGPEAIIGSFFFENEQGEAVAVNGDLYWAMLKEFFFHKN